MTSQIYFDDALPRFAKLVLDECGVNAITHNLFLRDATGRLTFVVLNESISEAHKTALARKAVVSLQGYVDKEEFSVSTPHDLFDESLEDLSFSRKISLNHQYFKGSVNVVDRYIVGADWLSRPALAAPAPIRFVFASLKGGVGRSTALCVLAAHLATSGRRVLAIDMDLEAPGLGNMLLPDNTLPEFGLLDYLVERGINKLDETFFVDLVGHSWLGGGRGRVDVIPAIGQRSLKNSANVISKLARAYLAEDDGNGNSRTFADHMRDIVQHFSDPLRYDAILIDARAGLHETTAAAVVGLGAEVLFFGINQPQTFAGYDLLFSHLATLPVDTTDDWRDRIQIIHSKSRNSEDERKAFKDNMEGLMLKHFWEDQFLREIEVDLSSLTDTFDTEWNEASDTDVDALIDTEMLSPILEIGDDERFRFFDPVADRDILSEKNYMSSYRTFLEMAVTLVDAFSEVAAPGGGN